MNNIIKKLKGFPFNDNQKKQLLDFNKSFNETSYRITKAEVNGELLNEIIFYDEFLTHQEFHVNDNGENRYLTIPIEIFEEILKVPLFSSHPNIKTIDEFTAFLEKLYLFCDGHNDYIFIGNTDYGYCFENPGYSESGGDDVWKSKLYIYADSENVYISVGLLGEPITQGSENIVEIEVTSPVINRASYQTINLNDIGINNDTYIDVLRIKWTPFYDYQINYINLKPECKIEAPYNKNAIYKFTGTFAGFYTSIFCERNYGSLNIMCCICDYPIVENTLNIIIDDSISLNDNFNHQITKDNRNTLIQLGGDARLVGMIELENSAFIDELFNIHVYGKLTPSDNNGKIIITPIVQRESYHSFNDSFSFYGTMVYPFNHASNGGTMKKITVKMVGPSTCTLTITNEDYT